MAVRVLPACCKDGANIAVTVRELELESSPQDGVEQGRSQGLVLSRGRDPCSESSDALLHFSEPIKFSRHTAHAT
jgi:hypothetical protein